MPRCIASFQAPQSVCWDQKFRQSLADIFSVSDPGAGFGTERLVLSVRYWYGFLYFDTHLGTNSDFVRVTSHDASSEPSEFAFTPET